MDSLAKCPFCGGEARMSGERFENTILSWVYCVACGAAGGYRHTEAEAIAAWDTRYHSAFEETVIKAWKEIKDYTERTCKNVDEYARAGFFICGNCGFGKNNIELTPNYCPNCGAKVVS